MNIKKNLKRNNKKPFSQHLKKIKKGLNLIYELLFYFGKNTNVI